MYTDRYEVLAHKLLEQLRPWRKNIGLTRKDGNNYITYSIKVNNK